MTEKMKRIGAAIAALVFAVMAIVIRRKTRELHAAKIDTVHCYDDLANQKSKDEIESLEGKVEADEKDRDEKDSRLDALLSSDERRRAGPRG
jgi:hypothetical protein